MESGSGLRVLTIPLITEGWQRDLLKKRMNLLRSLYNSELHQAKKRLAAMYRDERYKAFKKEVSKVYLLKPF